MSAPLYDKSAALKRISLLEQQAAAYDRENRPVQARSIRQSIHVLQALWSIPDPHAAMSPSAARGRRSA